MKLGFVAPVVWIALLAGCASDPGPSGPGRGAPVIASVAATKEFDDVDQAFMTEHFAKAMDNTMIGQTASWTTPSGGTLVRVSPSRTFQREDSTYCRDFTQSVGDNKDQATTHGTACRQSDGSWQIVG